MRIDVPDMMCENCVKRISNAMAEANVAVEISLENKTVEVADADEAKAKEILDDLGF